MLSLLHVLLISIAVGLVYLLLLFVSLGLRRYRKAVFPHSSRDVSILIVLGSGGHTTELLRLVSSLGPHFHPRHYIVANCDRSSEAALLRTESNKTVGRFTVTFVPRSRQIGQNYWSSTVTTLRTLFSTLPVVVAHKPDVVLCNGPGTCVPVCFWAFILDLFLVKSTRIIFVESVCRVNHLSMSGRILYHLRIADRILVQWSKLLNLYPRAEFVARF